MTDLTDLMRRATDDLDVPVSALVDTAARRGRRRRRLRTGGQVLAVACAVLAIATGGVLAGQRQQGADLPAIGGTPEQLLTTLKETMPPGGRIHNANTSSFSPYRLEARILYDAGGHRGSVVATVTRGPAGPPACPPQDKFAGSCEIRPDGSALLRQATKAGPGVRKNTLANAEVKERRPDGISVSLNAGVLDGSRGHLFSLDRLTAMIDGQSWPEPATTGNPARDPSGQVVTGADGEPLFDDEIVVSNPGPTPS